MNPDYAIEPGIRRGPEPFLDALGRLRDQFNYDSLKIVEWDERGDRAFVIVDFVGSGKGSGAPVDGRFAHVFEFRGSNVLRLSWFMDADEGRALFASE